MGKSSGLSIVCVTRGEDHAGAFLGRLSRFCRAHGFEFVVGADGPRASRLAKPIADTVVSVKSAGYIESVLPGVLQIATGAYTLRLDDDEEISKEMADWLISGCYTESDVWSFKRKNLWEDTNHYIQNRPLYPDVQTRLHEKHMTNWEDRIHAGSPHGPGRTAPCDILHHKFLIRDRSEREAYADEYERLQDGAGRSEMYLPFQLPELAFDELDIGEVI